MIFIWKIFCTLALIITTAMVVIIASSLLLRELDKHYWYIQIGLPIIMCAIVVYLWLYPWYNFIMI